MVGQKTSIDPREFAARCGLQFIDDAKSLRDYQVNADALLMVEGSIAAAWHILPVSYDKLRRELVVITSNEDVILRKTAELIDITKVNTIKYIMAGRTNVVNGINHHYALMKENSPARKLGSDYAKVLQTTREMEEFTAPEKEPVREEEIQLEEAPVINLANTIIQDAVRSRASDIHFEPTAEGGLRVRFRIDGVLNDVNLLPKTIRDPLISRYKIMCGMNVAIRNEGQDGNNTQHFDGRKIEFRYSTLPVVDNMEKLVIRIQDDQKLLEIDEVGLAPDIVTTLKTVLKKPHGMLLFTGPTGSGKSTSLAACIMHLKSPKVNIQTVEDPVEFKIEGVNQTQVRPHSKRPFGFPQALRIILRQDPNIIMVGEIRDHETSDLALNAAMTGHLLLSSLHANNVVEVVTRLTELGNQRGFILQAMNAVLDQRLIRVICPKCKTIDENPDLHKLSDAERTMLAGHKIYKGTGCNHCSQTGYYGRRVVAELLVFTEDVKEVLRQDQYNIRKIYSKLRETGHVTIWDNMLELLKNGITSTEELAAIDKVDAGTVSNSHLGVVKAG